MAIAILFTGVWKSRFGFAVELGRAPSSGGGKLIAKEREDRISYIFSAFSTQYKIAVLLTPNPHIFGLVFGIRLPEFCGVSVFF